MNSKSGQVWSGWIRVRDKKRKKILRTYKAWYSMKTFKVYYPAILTPMHILTFRQESLTSVFNISGILLLSLFCTHDTVLQLYIVIHSSTSNWWARCTNMEAEEYQPKCLPCLPETQMHKASFMLARKYPLLSVAPHTGWRILDSVHTDLIQNSESCILNYFTYKKRVEKTLVAKYSTVLLQVLAALTSRIIFQNMFRKFKLSNFVTV